MSDAKEYELKALKKSDDESKDQGEEVEEGVRSTITFYELEVTFRVLKNRSLYSTE